MKTPNKSQMQLIINSILILLTILSTFQITTRMQPNQRSTKITRPILQNITRTINYHKQNQGEPRETTPQTPKLNVANKIKQKHRKNKQNGTEHKNYKRRYTPN